MTKTVERKDGDKVIGEDVNVNPATNMSSSAPITIQNNNNNNTASPLSLKETKSEEVSPRGGIKQQQQQHSMTNIFQCSAAKNARNATRNFAKKVGKFTSRTAARVGSDLKTARSQTTASFETSTEFFMERFHIERRSMRKGGRKYSFDSSTHTTTNSTTIDGSDSAHDPSSGNDHSAKDDDEDDDHLNGDESDEEFLPLSCQLGTFLLADSVILWVVVISIVLDQLVRNYDDVWNNQFPIGVVLALCLLSFTIGLALDESTFLKTVKGFLSFVEEPKVDLYGEYGYGHTISSTLSSDSLGADTGKKERTSFFEQVLKRSSIYVTKPIKSTQRTVLKRRKSVIKKQNNDLLQSPIMKRLQKFGKRNLKMIDLSKYASTDNLTGDDLGLVIDETSSSSSTTPATTPQQGEAPDGGRTESNFSLGSASGPDSMAEDLITHVSKPLGTLRGRDLFRTEDADPDMMTHPFLLENGLRDCPTFMINILTVFGNICIYFRLPDWVEDFDESLEENEDDFPSVKALKRFLRGDDEYRKKCLKVMPELVDGPTAVKFLAPRNKAFPLELTNLMTTTYKQEPATESDCPVMQVTLDLVTNSTIRGFVGIFKRNMHRMVVDFACLIDPGDDEPSAVIGLWRMNRLEFDSTPVLPDRYTSNGISREDADSIRASVLVQECTVTSVMVAGV